MHSSFPIGPLTAVFVPFVSLVWLLSRWVSVMLAKTPRELAYWTRLPVLWSATWPYGPAHEAEEVAREIAHAIAGKGGGVVGFAAMRDDAVARELTHAVAERLQAGGESCAILESPEPTAGTTVVHAIESSDVGEQLEALRAQSGLVLFSLPSVEDREAVRAARRWLDAMVILVPSGEIGFFEIAMLRRAIGMETGTVGVALLGVEESLLVVGGRTAGDCASFWERGAAEVV